MLQVNILSHTYVTNQVWPLHLTSSILICTGNDSAKKAKGCLLHGLLTQLDCLSGRQAPWWFIHRQSAQFAIRTQDLSSANTHYSVIVIETGHLLRVTQSSGVWCSVWGSSHDGTKAQFAFSPGLHRYVRPLCVWVCREGRPSFLAVSPSSWRSSNIPVMGFKSFLFPLDRPFIPLWHRQRGFPGEFYKCPSGGTAGTSLFPSARKLSSEHRQRSAWWESWRSFWSVLECDSQCWSGMRHMDRNEGI